MTVKIWTPGFVKPAVSVDAASCISDLNYWFHTTPYAENYSFVAGFVVEIFPHKVWSLVRMLMRAQRDSAQVSCHSPVYSIIFRDMKVHNFWIKLIGTKPRSLLNSSVKWWPEPEAVFRQNGRRHQISAAVDVHAGDNWITAIQRQSCYRLRLYAECYKCYVGLCRERWRSSLVENHCCTATKAACPHCLYLRWKIQWNG